MTSIEMRSSRYFDSLRDEGQSLAERGQLDEALPLLERALSWAREHGDRSQVDLAICNRAAILLMQQRGRDVIRDLRNVLMTSADPLVQHYASYYICVFYEFEKNYAKELFYARIALKHAATIEDDKLIASSHNQIGNALIAMSYFEEAHQAYRDAQRLLPSSEAISHALILDNLAYCDVIQERYREGFRRLFESLRLLRRSDARKWEGVVRLGLCFAYLSIGKLDAAKRHGECALALAEANKDTTKIKNCYYLLGESEKLAGNREAAYLYFTFLQEAFYPEQPFIVDFLMTTDILQIINLRA